MKIACSLTLHRSILKTETDAYLTCDFGNAQNVDERESYEGHADGAPTAQWRVTRARGRRCYHVVVTLAPATGSHFR